MKKNFTLIELIVVIAILGILASILIPNISNVQGKASQTAVVSNVKSLQTAVDMYAVENQNLPAMDTPTDILPQPIDFTKIYPAFIRNLPKGANLKYWIDVNGQVWASKVDAPKIISTEPTHFTWGEVPDSTGYQVYEVQHKPTTSALKQGNVIFKKVTNGFKEKGQVSFAGEEGKVYTVSSFDKDGLETASVGSLESVDIPTNPNPTPINQAPTALIVMSPDSDITDKTNIIWSHNSTDPDGTIVSLEWKIDGVVVANPTNNLSGGTHIIELRVQDNEGAWSDWDRKSVVVSSTLVLSNMVSGNSYSITFLNDGTIKSVGKNNLGQLGLGDKVDHLIPATIAGLTNVKEMYTSDYTNMALLNDGTVKAWGSNSNGQLGLGDKIDRTAPTTISGLTNVKQIVLNNYMGMALLNDGTVKSWGLNDKGQLGLGDTTNRTTPTTISGLTNVKQLYSDDYSLGQTGMALLNDGTVKAWGFNGLSQLGLGDVTNRTVPTTVTGLTNVKEISLATCSGMALLNDGTVKSWGYNVYGQLGLGISDTMRSTPSIISGLTNVKKLYIRNYRSMALLNDGTVKSWGLNSYSQLGLGDTTDRTSPKTVSGLTNVKELSLYSYSSMALLNDGTVAAWGSNSVGQLGLGDKTVYTNPTTIVGLTNVQKLNFNVNSTLALLNDGTVRAWGSNSNGQLGLGDTINRKIPTVVSVLN